MVTERTTEGESPVKKAKAHNKTKRDTERTHLPVRPFRATGRRIKKRKAYRSPMCNPDRARI